LQLPHQNLTFQASWPGLFVDKKGAYWDVPLSLSADLASVGSSSGLSYHVLLQQNSGAPKCFGGDETNDVPVALLPGLCAKAAISIKKSIDVWRRKEDKLKNVQPYDVFLSDSHVSFTGIVGKHSTFHLILINDYSFLESELSLNYSYLLCNLFKKILAWWSDDDIFISFQLLCIMQSCKTIICALLCINYS
jgi:hypothetical protein